MDTDRPLVLVVDDEPTLRLIACSALSIDHYRTMEASTARQAFALAESHVPDLILLDLGLPDMDGLDTLRQLREQTTAPIIVFSARGSIEDKVIAVGCGAADFISKPFVVGQLLSCLRPYLTPVEPAETVGSAVRFGDLRIDVLNGWLRLGERQSVLTAVETRLLSCLVDNTGRLLTYRSLGYAAWGQNWSGDELAVRTAISRLRKKLEADPAHPCHLVAELGCGYRFLP